MPAPQGLIAVTAAAASVIEAARRRWPAALLCLGLALLCAGVALLCALAALWLVLIPWLGPVGAPLVIAAVLVVLCGLLLLLGWRLMRPRRVSGEEAWAALIGGAARLVEGNEIAALLIALAAGVAAGRQRRR